MVDIVTILQNMACQEYMQFAPEGTMLDTPGGKEYLRLLFLVPPLEVPKIGGEDEARKRIYKEWEKMCALSCLTTQQDVSIQYA
jgi:hypothetical protein